MKRLMLPVGLLMGLQAAFAITASAQDAPDATGEAALPSIAVEPSSPAAEAPPPLPPPADDEPVGLEEVVVTSQKRKQSLQEVPISVTAVDSQFIHDTGSQDLAHVSVYIPNVRVEAHDPSSPEVFIRGFGTNAFNPSFESSVALVQDEIYYGRPGYFTESLFDVDRVEVLRGPQGTLFGKNTIAGVYSVTTKDPTSDFEADGRVNYGEYNQQSVEGGVGGMFADWGGVRVSGLYRHQDGQLYNTFLNRDEEKLSQEAGRVKFRFLPLDTVTSDLIIQRSYTSVPFWPYELDNLDQATKAYLQSFDSTVEDNTKDFKTEFDTPGFIKKGSTTLASNTKWEIGDLGGLSNAAVVLVIGGSTFFVNELYDIDDSPADIATLPSRERHRQVSIEGRFSAEADSLFGLGQKVEFVTGGFYYDSHYQLSAKVNAGTDFGSYLLTRDACELAGAPPTACGDGSSIPGLPGLPVIGSATAPVIGTDYYEYDYRQHTLSIAGFSQATWNLTDHWALTPGVRLNTETKRVDTAGTQQCSTALPGNAADTGTCVVSILLMANPYNENGLSRSEFDVTPKMVLQYFSGGGINLYTSYARGYKSGGFNSLSNTGNNLAFKPEKAQTYELGEKSTFFENTLRFNTTLFLTKFQDLQTLAFNGTFFDVSNAGTATSKGLEGDLQWLTPYAPLSFLMTFGALDARYDTYNDAPAPIHNPQTGAIQIGATQSLNGKRLAFAPLGTGTFTPQLSYSFFGFHEKLAADVIYQGSQYTDTDLDPAKYEGGHTEYAARFILASSSENWSLTIGGNNLSNKLVLNQVINSTFFPGTYFAQQAGGRQLYSMISANF